ncbi:hypothetical protein [Actinophytocola sp.]|uniref:hypothetical protein n=1 Tax=Actinophytocola sp. TaxID=1872138 RepID=UPI002D7E82F9|nr:hypothetical protein [Actinophytocola sp.]HET9141149.1 hypothetical protein [Actinophytocola sp.]
MALAVTAIVAGTLVASVAPVSADVSADSPSLGLVRVESPATLQARGAAITVRVTFVGPASNPSGFPLGYLSLTVTERVGQQIATGTASASIGWFTGGAESIELTVLPSPGSAPFRRGTAFASATLNINFFPNPPPATDQREIQIVR